MPGSETMGMDMTEQTARAEDAAAPAEAAPLANQPGPTQPDPEAHAAELKDRLLRTLAEMENLRKRTDREIADSRAYAVAAFARDVLGVADNMRRALDAISPTICSVPSMQFRPRPRRRPIPASRR